MSDPPPLASPKEGSGEGSGDRRVKPADAVLAAELALGVLDAPARARAEARAASDDLFAADAAAWTGRLSPLIDEIAAVAPAATLWERIAAAAGLDPVTGLAPRPMETAAHSDDPAAAPFPGGAARRDNVVPLRPSRALAAWRAAAVAGFALAAASLAMVVYLVDQPVRGGAPLLAAKLAPVSPGPSIIGSEPLFTATLDLSRGSVVMTPISPGPVDPRARELWLIPKGGKPIPAGLLDVAHIRPVLLKPELLRVAQAGATLAVSLEPQGGSPSGSPTGPVIAAGVLDRI